MNGRHGKPAAVIISAEEYQRSLAPRKSLTAALRARPEELSPLLGKRPKQIARKVNPWASPAESVGETP